jgi:cytochrome oxidase Cu insertion factor (SCO1/SenC/PrrC family)
VQHAALKMLAVVLALMLMSLQQPVSAGVVTIGGTFALSASDGTTMSDATYRGKWLPT